MVGSIGGVGEGPERAQVSGPIPPTDQNWHGSPRRAVRQWGIRPGPALVSFDRLEGGPPFTIGRFVGYLKLGSRNRRRGEGSCLPGRGTGDTGVDSGSQAL